MEIGIIGPVNINSVQQILKSNKISNAEKAKFIRTHRAEIETVMQKEITSADVKHIMQQHPLKPYQPIKNFFTKKGDKELLALSLGIQSFEVERYIDEIVSNVMKQDYIDKLELENIDKCKSYVYRHGTKEQVVSFLDHELKYAHNKLLTLYQTLDYEMGGVADYFRRPIHKMDNRTLVNLYTVMDNHLDAMQKTGNIDEKDKLRVAKYCLVKIYKIQNDPKLHNAIRVYNKLT